MSDNVELFELMRQSWGLPNGPAKVELLERAVAMADQLNDATQAFDIRMDLIDAATFSGRTDLSLVHFAWCLARYDEDPESFDQFGLYWKYKWIAGQVDNFPAISLRQIRELDADMASRFLAARFNLRAIWQTRMERAIGRGIEKDVTHAYLEFKKLKRDSISNCEACEADAAVRYDLFLGQDRRAIQMAKPITSGKKSCSSIPHRTFNRLLVPFVRIGETDEAERLHQIGIRLSLRHAESVSMIDGHILYLAIRNRLTEAMKYFNRTIAAAWVHVDPTDQFDYYRAGFFLLSRVESLKNRSKPKLPSAHPLANESPKDLVPKLKDWLGQECESLATQFDTRNETQAFHKRLTDLQNLHALADELQGQSS